MDATFEGSSLAERMEQAREIVEKRLVSFWQEQSKCYAHDDIKKLHDAMAYALEGGKRLRAFLVLEGLYFAMERPLTPDEQRALADVMLAVEMLHAYSLVHDDLPAMDDDDLRRGRPTLHKAYDEATAILAGDGLLTAVFEVLSRLPLAPHIVVDFIHLFARHGGRLGMIAGQMIDVTGDKKNIDLQQLQMMQSLKTAELFSCALSAGVMLIGKGGDAYIQNFSHKKHNTMALMHEIGKAIGKLFQIVDDMLDVEGDESLTGKKTGSDQDKITWYTFMDRQEIQQEIEKTLQDIVALASFLPEEKKEALILFGHQLAKRKS